MQLQKFYENWNFKWKFEYILSEIFRNFELNFKEIELMIYEILKNDSG